MDDAGNAFNDSGSALEDPFAPSEFYRCFVQYDKEVKTHNQ